MNPAPLPLKTILSCSNPDCSNLFTISVKQKKVLLTENYLKYGKVSMPYCSKACQENHFMKLSQSRFFEKGYLKNHEAALVREGANVKKRWKNKGEIELTNEETELIEELKTLVSEKDAEILLSTNPSQKALSVIVSCLQKKQFEDLNNEWNSRLGKA